MWLCLCNDDAVGPSLESEKKRVKKSKRGLNRAVRQKKGKANNSFLFLFWEGGVFPCLCSKNGPSSFPLQSFLPLPPPLLVFFLSLSLSFCLPPS